MANKEQLIILKRGAKAWNKWRRKLLNDIIPDLRGVDLSGADLRRANLIRADLGEADLRGTDLVGADLRRADLRGADLTKAFLRRANLKGGNLDGAVLKETDLSEVELSEASLVAYLQRATLIGATLIKADLSGATLIGANLAKATLIDALLEGADLDKANLMWTSLTNAKLTRASLHRADLTGANLREAELSEADLSGASLRRVNLSGANLSEANLLEANLSEANLSGADLTGADLRRTILIQADFSQAIVSGVNLYATAREDWRIDSIQCNYIYWDNEPFFNNEEQKKEWEQRHRTPKDRDFRSGEFEDLYKQLPTFEYVFEHGFTALDAVIMSRIVEAINKQHPEFELKLDSFHSRGQPHAKFTVLHKEYIEAAKNHVTTGYESRIAALEGKQEQLMHIVSTLINKPQQIGEVIIGNKMITAGQDYFEHVQENVDMQQAEGDIVQGDKIGGDSITTEVRGNIDLKGDNQQLAIGKNIQQQRSEVLRGGTIDMGDKHIGRDNIEISGHAHVNQIKTGDSFQDQAQQKLEAQKSKQDSTNRVDLLLITVTKGETLAVLNLVEKKLGHKYTTEHIDLQTYYDLGSIGGARTFMLRSEMGSGGPSGSTTTVSEAITTLNPSAIIMVGIAFGIDENTQQIGDILISKQLLGYELQRVGTGKKSELVIIPRGDRPSASPRLLARFRDGELHWDGAKVRFGLVLSGDKLVDNIDFRDQLCTLEPEAIGGEMEGEGLYSAAHRAKIDWIMVKAICDWADGKKDKNKSRRQETAAHNAASFVLHVIERGGFAESEQNSTY